MSTRLAVSALAFVALLAACDASISESDVDRFSSVAIGAGFGCGLTGDGNALCWGEGGQGQLGDGKGVSRTDPARIATGTHFSQLAVGSAHACGLATNGRVLCWGSNDQRQLGTTEGELDCQLLQSNGWMQDFGDNCSTVPVPLDTDLRFKAIGTGATHTCGLTSGGEIWCWGTASYPLGDSVGYYAGSSAAPLKVTATAHFNVMAIGEYHACAADNTGQGWCWGQGWNGQTGLGTAESLTPYRAAPAMINSTAYLRALTVGSTHTCALTSSDEAVAGSGGSGQRGDSTVGQARHNPTYVKTDRKFSAIAAGNGRTCAIEKGTNAAWCWGENFNGSLGVGVAGYDQFAPAEVLGGLSFSRLSLTRFFGFEAPPPPICGTTEDGVYCWGQVPQPLTFEE